MNLSTVKWAQWDKTQSRELLGLFICVCIALCTIVTHNIAQNRPLTFQAITIAPMMSIWGKGRVAETRTTSAKRQRHTYTQCGPPFNLIHWSLRRLIPYLWTFVQMFTNPVCLHIETITLPCNARASKGKDWAKYPRIPQHPAHSSQRMTKRRNGKWGIGKRRTKYDKMHEWKIRDLKIRKQRVNKSNMRDCRNVRQD